MTLAIIAFSMSSKRCRIRLELPLLSVSDVLSCLLFGLLLLSVAMKFVFSCSCLERMGARGVVTAAMIHDNFSDACLQTLCSEDSVSFDTLAIVESTVQK